MLEKFPEWLNSFSFKIEDEYNTLILNEDETTPDNVMFDDSNLGIRIGSRIFVMEEQYNVKNFYLYSSAMTNQSPEKRMSADVDFELHIIVEKVLT